MTTHSDRRRHKRASTELGARIHPASAGRAQDVVRGRSVDLSRGGVRIRLSDDDAPCPAVGTAVMVELEIGPRGWLAQDGRVVRCDVGELVIGFDALSDDAVRQIDGEVITAVAASSRPRLLIVDSAIDRRHHIAEKVRAAGCDAFEVGTPLEAIEMMECPSNHITGVAVAQQLTQTDGDEFCDFVAETNPGITLARIADLATPDGDDAHLERSIKGFVDAVHVHTPRPARS
jgi:PilZ domain